MIIFTIFIIITTILLLYLLLLIIIIYLYTDNILIIIIIPTIFFNHQLLWLLFDCEHCQQFAMTKLEEVCLFFSVDVDNFFCLHFIIVV